MASAFVVWFVVVIVVLREIERACEQRGAERGEVWSLFNDPVILT